MLTRQQVMTATRFHDTRICPCGTRYSNNLRRNGATKTWKTRPDEFRIPVKFGLRGYSYLEPADLPYVHTEEDCTYVAGA